jgi:hypothetical protein
MGWSYEKIVSSGYDSKSVLILRLEMEEAKKTFYQMFEWPKMWLRGIPVDVPPICEIRIGFSAMITPMKAKFSKIPKWNHKLFLMFLLDTGVLSREIWEGKTHDLARLCKLKRWHENPAWFPSCMREKIEVFEETKVDPWKNIGEYLLGR